MVVQIRYERVTTFRKQLAQVPKEIRRELRPRIKAAADLLASRVRANASWSSRIPGAVKTKVSFASRNGGVTVYVDSDAAPHARPLEFGSKGRSNVNRHPVWGRDTWTDQPTRPFFMPAVQQSEQDVVREIQAAIDAAFNKL